MFKLWYSDCSFKILLHSSVHLHKKSGQSHYVLTTLPKYTSKLHFIAEVPSVESITLHSYHLWILLRYIFKEIARLHLPSISTLSEFSNRFCLLALLTRRNIFVNNFHLYMDSLWAIFHNFYTLSMGQTKIFHRKLLLYMWQKTYSQLLTFIFF